MAMNFDPNLKIGCAHAKTKPVRTMIVKENGETAVETRLRCQRCGQIVEGKLK